jgi:hypothetical protein
VFALYNANKSPEVKTRAFMRDSTVHGKVTPILQSQFRLRKPAKCLGSARRNEMPEL